MKKIIMAALLLSSVHLFAQKGNSGVILNIEGSKIYVDVTSQSTKLHDVFNVYSEGGYFIHPVTKKRIKKDQEIIGKLEIVSTHPEYSEAIPIPQQSIKRMQTGMEIKRANNDTGNVATTETTNEDRVALVIAPAQVNDVVNNGYFGGYVADVLMEQLMTNNRIKLLDRSVLNAQMDESNLQGDYINPTTAIERGKISGAQYIIQITMQKPDVVNVTTGVPLASIMGTLQGISGKNLGAQYMSNATIGTLQASVSVTARVVDLQTGEVMFMCTGNGKAKGKSQMSMEYGALGGAQINGGADKFKQTVTGQALQKVFMVIGKSLNDHFNGKTTSKVVGSATGFGNSGQKLTLRKNNIYNGVDKLSNDDVKMTFTDQPELYFKYKKARNSFWKTSNLIIAPASGILCGVLFSQIAFSKTNRADNPSKLTSETCIAVFAGIGIGLYLGYLINQKINHRKLQNIVNQYNSSLSQSFIEPKKSTSVDISLISTGNGLGLRLFF
jgi:curli biogenesis system outer membrane secretion channel CsgG